MKDQFRVVHMQAPENVCWSHITGERNEILCSRLFEYFNHSKVFRDEVEALGCAKSQEKNIGYVEYGIAHLKIDKTWKEVLATARTEIGNEKLYLLSGKSGLSEGTVVAIVEELNHLYSDILKEIVKLGGS